MVSKNDFYLQIDAIYEAINKHNKVVTEKIKNAVLEGLKPVMEEITSIEDYLEIEPKFIPERLVMRKKKPR